MKGGFLEKDVQLYFDSLGMPAPSIVLVSIDNQQNTGTFNQEPTLDIAVAGSAAPGARLVLYNAPNNENGWFDSVTCNSDPRRGSHAFRHCEA